MTGPPQDTRRPNRPSTQQSQNTDAYRRYRQRLALASPTDIPGLDPVLAVGTIAALAAAIGLAFAPWLTYTRNDGSSGSTNAIRSDGLVLVIAAVVAIAALVVAIRSSPGNGALPTLVGLCACVVGLIVTGFTLMDPAFIFVDDPKVPAEVARGWGLYSAFMATLAATIGSFVHWREADHF